VIENRGAATSSGGRSCAAPDGYTLLLVGQPNAINATFYDALSFNFIRDIAPVAGIMTVPNVMVSIPRSGEDRSRVHRLRQANPSKIDMASAGSGSAAYLAGELFNSMAGISMVMCPIAGDSGMPTAGRASAVLFATSPASIEYVRSGKRALAVTTAVRAEALPSTAWATSCRATRRARGTASAPWRPPRSSSG
jgi:tripartite-type tricarboxylate transporter receptor subunit TctC